MPVNSVLIVVISLLMFLGAYIFYAGYLSKKIFGLNNKKITPSHSMMDGVDYVPANKWVLWGHHFASIAGLAPMLGPAIAVIWGWLPAVLWIVFGSIFMGAVHDFGSLVISERNNGMSIGTLSEKLISSKVRIPFLIIGFFLLALAMGVFAYIVGLLFTTLFYPKAVLPVFSIMAIAVVMGVLSYKLKFNLVILTIFGVSLMLGSIWLGNKNPVYLEKVFLSKETKQIIADNFQGKDYIKIKKNILEKTTIKTDFNHLQKNQKIGHKKVRKSSKIKKSVGRKKIAAEKPMTRVIPFKGTLKSNAEYKKEFLSAAKSGRSAWVYILLFYAFIASVLPVWILLQPRDYINSYLLYIGMGLMYLGIFYLHPYIAAPAVRLSTPEVPLPSLWPLLFITIACGAISGFHSLVSSGTTAKQLNLERDAKPIGYGGMLAEGMLALIAVMAVTAGAFTNKVAFLSYYSSWGAASGLGMKLGAFIKGSAVLLHSYGIPTEIGTLFITVMAVSFAMTTLDSGTRLLRFNIEELFSFSKLKIFKNRYFTGFLAVASIGFFALLKVKNIGSNGIAVYKPAGILLWQLFGITNQILALLGLLVVTFYLMYKKKPFWLSGIPALFMGVVTITALINKLQSFYQKDHYTLLIVGTLIMLLLLWIIGVSIYIFIKELFSKKSSNQKILN